MNVIAQSQITEHTLIRASEKTSVVILATSKITYQPENHRVVALSNNKNNLTYVINYYRDAGYSITLVIDSKTFPSLTASIMKDNYRSKARVSLYDNATNTHYLLNNFQNTISYLTLCHQIEPCSEVLQWLAEKVIRMIPLIHGTAQSCLNSYHANLEQSNISDDLMHALNQQLTLNLVNVRTFMSPSMQTNTTEINSLHSPICKQLIDNTPTLAIRSATGTGKTKYIFGPIIKSARENNKKVVYLSYLMALVQQYCDDNQAVSYNNPNLDHIEQSSAMGVVVNSIWKEHIRSFIAQADILIIDEFEKVLSTIVCSKESKQLPKQRVFACLSEIIKTIPQLIVGDADLSDISLGYLSRLRGDVTLLKCTQNPYTTIDAVITDKNQYISNANLKDQLLSDKVFLFDSLVTLRQVTKALGYEDSNGLDCEKAALKDGVLIVHGDNKGLPEQSAFLANPNKEINKYRAILASPCLGSGFSITTDFTKRVVVFCDKTLMPLELVNFARRFRAAKQIWFAVDAYQDFICQKSKDTEYNIHIHTQPTDALEIEFSNVKNRFNSPLALNLHLTLQELGFKTNSAPSSFLSQIMSSKSVSNESKSYRKLMVKTIVTSPSLAYSQAAMLLSTDKRSASDMAALTKYSIQNNYQLNEISEKDVLFHFEFLKNRAIFNLLPFVQSEKAETGRETRHQRAADFIFKYILKEHCFSKEKPSFCIHRDEVRQIVAICYKNKDVLNWALDKSYHIIQPLHKAQKTNKATTYIKNLLTSLGLEITPFSGGTGKAKVFLSSYALHYARIDIEQRDNLDKAA